MAKTDYSLTGFSITTVSTTTAFRALGQFITDFSGIELVAETEETHAMGDNWAENSPTGLNRVSPITLGGFYDDQADGPNAIFGDASDIGAERVIKVNYGTTNAYGKMDVIIKRYARKPIRGQLTKWEAELLPASSYVVVAT